MHGTATFDSLYARFDVFIEFLQTHPTWNNKLYQTKERFIRSKEKKLYSTDVFGFFDESEIKERSQISFYYSIHFHEYIRTHYPEFNLIPQISDFFDACYEIQQPYGRLLEEVAAELGLETIFSSQYGHPPILLKVIKYFPSYIATRAHYDGSAFSLFLDSTDNQSLFLSPYKSSFTIDDFSPPSRVFSRGLNQSSILLIPGVFLTEFSLYPTPHIVVQSGQMRYATIAFAMRPNHISPKIQFSPLPDFKN